MGARRKKKKVIAKRVRRRSRRKRALKPGMTVAEIKEGREKNPRYTTRPGDYSMAVSFRCDNALVEEIGAMYKELDGIVTQSEMVRLFQPMGLSASQIIKACRCSIPKYKGDAHA